MNLEMFNISKSCYELFIWYIIFLWTFDIQILLDNAMYYELIHKHYKEMS